MGALEHVQAGVAIGHRCPASARGGLEAAHRCADPDLGRRAGDQRLWSVRAASKIRSAINGPHDMVSDVVNPSTAGPPLLERVRQTLRAQRYSRNTEEVYLRWMRRFILFHGKGHPRELGERDVTAFLAHLADDGASASAQNQAVSAILFLCEVALGERPPWMDGIARVQRPATAPVVL